MNQQTLQPRPTINHEGAAAAAHPEADFDAQAQFASTAPEGAVNLDGAAAVEVASNTGTTVGVSARLATAATVTMNRVGQIGAGGRARRAARVEELDAQIEASKTSPDDKGLRGLRARRAGVLLAGAALSAVGLALLSKPAAMAGHDLMGAMHFGGGIDTPHMENAAYTVPVDPEDAMAPSPSASHSIDPSHLATPSPSASSAVSTETLPTAPASSRADHADNELLSRLGGDSTTDVPAGGSTPTVSGTESLTLPAGFDLSTFDPNHLPAGVKLDADTVKLLNTEAGQGGIGNYTDAQGNELHSIDDGLGHPGTPWHSALTDARSAGYDVKAMTKQEQSAYVATWMQHASVDGHTPMTEHDAEHLQGTYTYHMTNGDTMLAMAKATAHHQGGPLMPKADSPAGTIVAKLQPQLGGNTTGTTTTPGAVSTETLPGTSGQANRADDALQKRLGDATSNATTPTASPTHSSTATHSASPSPTATAAATSAAATPHPTSATPNHSASSVAVAPATTEATAATTAHSIDPTTGAPTTHGINGNVFAYPTSVAKNPTSTSPEAALPVSNGENNTTVGEIAALGGVAAAVVAGAALLARRNLRNDRAPSNNETETDPDDEDEQQEPSGRRSLRGVIRDRLARRRTAQRTGEDYNYEEDLDYSDGAGYRYPVVPQAYSAQPASRPPRPATFGDSQPAIRLGDPDDQA